MNNNLPRRIKTGPAPFPRPEEEPLDWPSSRYFQVHFEHLHAALAAMGRELELLRHQVADLQWRSGCDAARCGRCPPAPGGERTQ